MQYTKVKASVLGLTPNMLIEDALIKLLEKTSKMKLIEEQRLKARIDKIKRIPISLMINEIVTIKARLLAKNLDVPFVVIIEAALQNMVNSDVDDIKTGKLDSVIIEEALKEYLNIEKQNAKTVLPKLIKHLENAKAKEQNPF